MLRGLSRTLAPAWLGALLTCIAVLVAGNANARTPQYIDLREQSCEFVAERPMALDAAIGRASPDACASDIGADGSRHWLVRTGLDIHSTHEAAAVLHIKQSLLSKLTAYAIYADGHSVKVVNDRWTVSKNIELGGIVCLHFPASDSPIVAVALEAEGVTDARGAFVRPAIYAGSSEGSHRGGEGVLYGVFAGVILATLAFNLVLYYWLRYTFLGFYCCMVGATVLYGVAQSGALHWLGFNLPPGTGVFVGEFSMGIIAWFSVLFTLALFEAGTVPAGLARLTRRIAFATAIAGTATLVVGIFLPGSVRVPITALNLIGATSLALVIPLCSIAAVRGSRVVYLFMLAWTLPIAGGVARILAGLGVIESSALIENSHFYAMCVESIISMFGIAYRIAGLRDQRDQARAREIELTQLAETDVLTGLLNRRGFVSSAIGLGPNERALVLIDIDHFKTVNDGFGHETGDSVLRAVARLIERIAPVGTLTGRLGGEEFAVMLGAADARLANVLVSAFRGTPMPEGIRLTVSAGVATGKCTNDVDWRLLYRRADAALYRAKSAGRDCVVFDGKPSDSREAA